MSIVREILRRAESAGIRIIDTAHAYGEAETVLGATLAGDWQFKIVSKIAPLRREVVTQDDIVKANASLQITLDRLGRRDLYALLVHDAGDLLAFGGDRLWSWLQSLKSGRIVDKIGVSVYSPGQLADVMDRFDIEIVQLPYNIYDRRFDRAGLLDRLRAAGIEVHSRSAFLQGLLLMVPDQMPRQFDGIRIHQGQLHDAMARTGLTPLAGSLSLCLNDPRIDSVVVGCESLEQLNEILEAATQPNACLDLQAFELHDEKILDPSRWTQIQ
jgi:aryl-alcohol dehydrogenase-like predicted oxidoreductase